MFPEDYNALFWGRDPGVAWEFTRAHLFSPYHWGAGQGSNWVEPEYLLETNSVGWEEEYEVGLRCGLWQRLDEGGLDPKDIRCSNLGYCLFVWGLNFRFSHSVVSNSLWPHELQHARLLSITNSWSLLKLLSIESVMPSSHLILCQHLLLPP